MRRLIDSPPTDQSRRSGRDERTGQERAGTGRNFLIVNAHRDHHILRGLASPLRLRILRLLLRQGPLNINQIAEALDQPQSTIASNVQILEDSDLISTTIGKAAKGQQKVCAARYAESWSISIPRTPPATAT